MRLLVPYQGEDRLVLDLIREGSHKMEYRRTDPKWHKNEYSAWLVSKDGDEFKISAGYVYLKDLRKAVAMTFGLGFGLIVGKAYSNG